MTTLRADHPPVKSKRPRPKPVRTVRLHFPPLGGQAGALTITEGRKETDYLLFYLPSDFGLAYRFEKQGDDYARHDVCLDPEEHRHSCDCLGHMRYGYCRHVACLLKLHATGELHADRH